MKIIKQQVTLAQVFQLMQKPDIVSLIMNEPHYEVDAMRLFKAGPIQVPVIDSAKHFDWIMKMEIYKKMTRLPIQVRLFEEAVIAGVPEHLRAILTQTSGLQFTNENTPHRQVMLHHVGNALGLKALPEKVSNGIDYFISEFLRANRRFSSRKMAELLTDHIVFDMFDEVFDLKLIAAMRQFLLEMREYLIRKLSPAAIFGVGKKESQRFEEYRDWLISEVYASLQSHPGTIHSNPLLRWLQDQVLKLNLDGGIENYLYALTVKVISLMQALLDTTSTVVSSLLISMANPIIFDSVKRDKSNALAAVYVALHMASPLIIDPREAVEDLLLTPTGSEVDFFMKKGKMVYFNLLHIGRHRIHLEGGEDAMFSKFAKLERPQQFRLAHFASVFMGVDGFSCKASGLAVEILQQTAYSLCENMVKAFGIEEGPNDIDLNGVMTMDAVLVQ